MQVHFTVRLKHNSKQLTTDFKAKMHVIRFRSAGGSVPDPAGGAYSAPPDPLAGFKGHTSKGRKGKGMGGERFHFYAPTSIGRGIMKQWPLAGVCLSVRMSPEGGESPHFGDL